MQLQPIHSSPSSSHFAMYHIPSLSSDPAMGGIVTCSMSAPMLFAYKRHLTPDCFADAVEAKCIKSKQKLLCSPCPRQFLSIGIGTDRVVFEDGGHLYGWWPSHVSFEQVTAEPFKPGMFEFKRTHWLQMTEIPGRNRIFAVHNWQSFRSNFI